MPLFKKNSSEYVLKYDTYTHPYNVSLKTGGNKPHNTRLLLTWHHPRLVLPITLTAHPWHIINGFGGQVGRPDVTSFCFILCACESFFSWGIFIYKWDIFEWWYWLCYYNILVVILVDERQADAMLSWLYWSWSLLPPAQPNLISFIQHRKLKDLETYDIKHNPITYPSSIHYHTKTIMK